MQLIDYRNTYWGHSFYSYPARVEGTDYHLLAWFRRKITVGDEVVWKTEYGYLSAKVVQTEWKIDPSDMYALDVKIIRRFDHDGNLLWAE